MHELVVVTRVRGTAGGAIVTSAGERGQVQGTRGREDDAGVGESVRGRMRANVRERVCVV